MLGGILELLGRLIYFVSFVSDNSSFPDPLSPEEEQEYISLCMEGDENAKNKLIEHNLRLVAHIVKKYNNCGMDSEDLISIGTIGLIKAVSTYAPTRGTQLATYAARCIENEILMSIRNQKKRKSEVLLDDPIGIDREGNAISFLDVLGTHADAISDEVEIRIESGVLLNIMTQVLTARERIVLKHRYGLGGGSELTQREIASMLGISRSYVSRIEKKAIMKLENELKHFGKIINK